LEESECHIDRAIAAGVLYLRLRSILKQSTHEEVRHSGGWQCELAEHVENGQCGANMLVGGTYSIFHKDYSIPKAAIMQNTGHAQ
jgi:hypothetical protein